MRLRIDLRTLLVAAVLAAAAALPQFTDIRTNREYFFFDVTLTSTSAGSTQFFWDKGKGFNEDDSSRQPLKIEPQPVVYRFMMPMGPIDGLRFDPVDGMGTFSLSHARIVDHLGRVVREFAPADFVPVKDIARCTVQGDNLYFDAAPGASDPVLRLRLHTPLELLPPPGVRWTLYGRQLGPVFLAVLALGGLLGWPAVARRLDRLTAHLLAAASARPVTALLLTSALAVAIQAHPVIFQGRSFASPALGTLMLYGDMPTLPGDTPTQFTSTMGSDTGALLFQHLYYSMAQRDALSAGELPLWNRYSLCGEPLLGQGQSMFGDPMNFLTIATHGAAWAWDVRFLFVHWLFAAACALCVWRLTRHLGASLLVAATAVFLGFYTYRLIHPANFGVAYAPLLLLTWIGFLQAATPRRQALWLAGTIGAHWCLVTSGTMKEAYMLVLGMDLAGLCLLALLPAIRGRRGRLLGLATAAGAVFVLLSAPLWLSFLVTWKHSFTSYDQPHAYALQLPHLIGFFDDIFYRQTVKDEAVLAPALNFFLMLGCLWWLAHPRLWREQRGGLALLLAGLPPFALAFGLVPLAVVLKIPFVNNIGHIGNTFSCVLLPLATVLAGCGFAAAFARWGQPEWRAGARRVAGLFALLLLAYVLTSTEVPKSRFFLTYVVGLAVGTLALLFTPVWTDRERRGALWVAFGLGLPILLWRHTQYAETRFEAFAFKPGQRVDLHTPSPAVAFLDAHRTEPGRVVGWGNNLFPSYNTALHWESLYGVDAVRSYYYDQLARLFDLERVWVWDALNRPADAGRLLPIHDLLNVTHYLGTHREPPLDIPGLRLIGRQDLEIYARPGAWPRAFFTDRVKLYATPEEFVTLVRTGDGRPFAARQTTEPAPLSWPAQRGDTIEPATGYRFTPNSTAFTICAAGPGVAVLTETYYAEDFRVTVNGRPASYFRVNHSFKGVALPSAGTYEIRFAYWPQHFTLALWLGGAGVAWLVAGLWWLTRRPALTGGAA